MFTDFNYNNKNLSDFGLSFIYFNFADGFQISPSGSQLGFNTVKNINGSKFNLYGSSYEEPFSTTFQIGKYNKDTCDIDYITPQEVSKINGWLNQKTFKKFTINKSGYENIYWNGSFNTQQIKINDLIVGLEITLNTDSPYAHEKIDEQTYKNKKQIVITNTSDETGDIYPKVKIKCLEAGDLRITNSLDNEIFKIDNCSVNEVIEIDNEYKTIVSNVLTHKLYNDFNYNYLKIINDGGNGTNTFTSSLSIDFTISYSVARKVGI